MNTLTYTHTHTHTHTLLLTHKLRAHPSALRRACGLRREVQSVPHETIISYATVLVPIEHTHTQTHKHAS